MLRSNKTLFIAGFAAVVMGFAAGWVLLKQEAPQMARAASLTIGAAAPEAARVPEAARPPARTEPAPARPAPIAAAPAPPSSAPKPPPADDASEAPRKRDEIRFEGKGIGLYADKDRAGARTPFGKFEFRW